VGLRGSVRRAGSPHQRASVTKLSRSTRVIAARRRPPRPTARRGRSIFAPRAARAQNCATSPTPASAAIAGSPWVEVGAATGSEGGRLRQSSPSRRPPLRRRSRLAPTPKPHPPHLRRRPTTTRTRMRRPTSRSGCRRAGSRSRRRKSVRIPRSTIRPPGSLPYRRTTALPPSPARMRKTAPPPGSRQPPPPTSRHRGERHQDRAGRATHLPSLRSRRRARAGLVLRMRQGRYHPRGPAAELAPSRSG
jgi:hypothetical protein